MRRGVLLWAFAAVLAAAPPPVTAQIFLPAPRPAEPEPGSDPAPDADAGPAVDGGDTEAEPSASEGVGEPDAGDEPETGEAADGDEQPRPGFKRAPFRTLGPAEPEIIIGVETEPRQGARLRRLDKMTGATETVEIATGSVARFGRLEIAVDACEAPPDGRIEGTRAFVRVWDRQHDADAPAFSGWMFADSPALSALDHPRFDVWVISCTTS